MVDICSGVAGIYTGWVISLYPLRLQLQMTVCAMTAGMFWPALGIRQGWLTPEDSRDFPVYLKKRMKLGMYCILIAVAWMAFVALLVQVKRV